MRIIGIGIVAIVLFFLQKILYSRVWNRDLNASVRFEQSKLVEGEVGTLLEVIENRKKLPLPMLKAQFQTSKNLAFEDEKETKTSDQYYRNDVFSVGGRERVRRKLSFVCKK